ncbi:hypothetical protein GLAREA_09338 [Glarea lozoyensis ATCC 20868]|uniref:Uncharacterized protein n=1 Tax=Glarea lozoyensis (strain ATCC 20868 / MF5171) TaxID=1116229 RepID=S3DP29_GLAL2|nr:uncharacterized protein GLAREA_09338 [Glarea lozoyensis ATCC 20868]EPE28218.1 hypothetical protein GLAREA_09338 [Glarea lozoyensis ATCC 20868]
MGKLLLLLPCAILALCSLASAETGFSTTCVQSDSPTKQQRKWGMKACLSSLAKLSTCADNLKKGTYASTNIGNTVAVFSQSSNVQTLTALEAMHWCQVLVEYCVNGEVQCDSCSTSLYVYQTGSAQTMREVAFNSTGNISQSLKSTHSAELTTLPPRIVDERFTLTGPIQRRKSTLNERAGSCKAPGTSLVSNSFCNLGIVSYSLAESRVWNQKHSSTVIAALNSIISQFQSIAAQTGPVVAPVLSVYASVEDGNAGNLGTLTVTMDTYNGRAWNEVVNTLQASVDPTRDSYLAINAVVGVFGFIKNYIQETRSLQTGYGFDISDLAGNSLFNIFVSKTIEGLN